ncbi:hypothetical protein [Actinoallomurus iriomotensis]|uniref:Beta-lactamase n=1 Tax=Actinoallomurus iriomotensis TaxID=478107 RepID=A0A9W6VNE6_9ACTN|nr:hypothetical protein [Actinoallomurus iriomotensis]GLY73689.1 hypothetical protein Airi01_019560 [Actinoallomurus iriomotensis]
MRHLLTHTTGVDGDVFTDTGRGDDCLAKYAEALAEPEPFAAPAEPASADVDRHAGTYERAGERLEMVGGERPRLRRTATGAPAALLPESEREQEHDLVPVEEDLFAVRAPRTGMWLPVTFYALPTGERYLHLAGRATPKVP